MKLYKASKILPKTSVISSEKLTNGAILNIVASGNSLNTSYSP